MELRFYNTLSGRVETLAPRTNGQLHMYVCGPTVYDEAHLGHARSAVIFDVFRRFFDAMGYNVTLVRNITDIDDKILHRARQSGVDYRRIASHYHRSYDTLMATLGVRPPNESPRATAYVQPCQDIITRILENGHAYQRGASVYFATASCPGYGRLAKRSGQGPLQKPALSDTSEKRHPNDFALWKARSDGEPFWNSPWGPGRPGWHIECTAMSHYLLGTPFDIHGGGMDLIFPHHENEIAQARAAFGMLPAPMWVHHGLVTVGQAKMAKSKGNAPGIQDLLNTYHPEALRLFLLSRHYRRDLPFTESALQASVARLDRFYATARRLEAVFGRQRLARCRRSYLWHQFARRLASDGNVTAGLTVLFTTIRELNRVLDTNDACRYSTLWRTLEAVAADCLYISRHILGILQSPVEDYFHRRPAGSPSKFSRHEIERLVAKRLAARQSEDWQTADRLREILEAHSVRLRDQGRATLWSQGKRQGKVNA